MADMLTTMPDSFAAGTTVKFTSTFSDYPANGGWTATLYLAGISVLAPVTGSAVNESFQFTLAAANTKALKPGSYKWRITCQSGAEIYTAASGLVSVDQDLAQAGETDAQTFAEKALALVEARLLGRYTDDMESFSIAGRAVSQIPQRELLDVRDRLSEEIRMSKANGKFIRDVRVIFSGTGGEA